MFITAVCVIFLIKLRWPKNKSLYDIVQWDHCFQMGVNINMYTLNILPFTSLKVHINSNIFRLQY